LICYIGENEELVAFDTGPGNALIDDLMNKLFNLQYDNEGLFLFYFSCLNWYCTIQIVLAFKIL